jgi:hypothetical protein
MKKIGLLGLFVICPVFGQVSSATFLQDDTVRIAPRQHMPITGKAERNDGTVTSTNWSGYAVTGTSFTAAQASWIVPSVVCGGDVGNPTLYAAFWVGLDGYSQNSNTVEQTGTDSDCDGITARYYAWFEFYPLPSFQILSMQVHAGDFMSASVTFNRLQFTVTITDQTSGQTFTRTSFVLGAQRSSAEWIAEAPCCTTNGGILPMSNFGTVLFGLDSTGVAGTNSAASASASGVIGAFPAANVFEINKIGSTTSPQVVNCSALSPDGTSFSCTYGSGS